MKKIAVLGAKGMLGYAMSEYFISHGYDVLKITRAEFDIAKEPIEKLGQLIVDCDAVVNCAGVIKPQIAKMSIEDVLKVNSVFPRNLATQCKIWEIKCFHITTDCVYTGNKGEYNEDDFFDAEDVYGLSKNAGEPLNCMVLRTSIIGEEKGQSRSLLEWTKSQKGKPVNGFVNHFWNGVTTIHLAEVIEKILEQHFYSEGLYHIHSPNVVSKKDMLEIFNDVYNLNLAITPTEASYRCDRTLTSKYSLSKMLCSKTIQMQVYEMKDFFESVEEPVMKMS